MGVVVLLQASLPQQPPPYAERGLLRLGEWLLLRVVMVGHAGTSRN